MAIKNLPNDLVMRMAIQCSQCTATTSVGARAGNTTGGKRELVERLNEKGWELLTAGKATIGCLCETCLGRYVDDGREDGDDDIREVEEISADEIEIGEPVYQS